MIQARNAQSPEYYLTPDCPLEDGKLEARFGGKGARELGLAEFDEQAFLRLAKGLNPETGGKLTARLKADRIDATDFTLTVPKSVSVLIEVAGDERVKAALWDANNYAMRLVEKKAKVRVRKGGVNEDRETGNMVFASFYHATTRPIVEKRDPSTAHFEANGVEIVASAANDNRAYPDPHSHIHNYVFNLSKDALDAKTPWKAMKRHRFDLPEVERKANARLAKSLRKLGYQVEKTKTAFEVKGISAGVLGAFSRRQGEIKDVEADRPYLNEEGNKTFTRKMAAAKAQLSQVVRQPKSDYPLGRTELHRFWAGRISGSQFADLAALKGKAASVLRRDRWRDTARKFLDRVRQSAISRETSRGRPGFER